MEKENYNDNRRYDDIINLPHHVSAVHPRMPIMERAAQFSPFAALTGYGDAVRETSRLTDMRTELDEDAKEILDEKLRMLQERIEEYPEAAITYFQPDHRKAGGTYITAAGRIKKIDGYERIVVMQDGRKIPVGEITEIEEKNEGF